MIRIHNKTFAPLFISQEVEESIARIAKLINSQYLDSYPLFIVVLNGAFMFASDLLKQINVPCEVQFIRVASYDGAQTTGNVKQILGLTQPINNRHVIVIEDIIDTGLTMQFLLNELNQHHPAELSIATLLFKKEALKVPIEPHYVGFEIPNKFVLGYGLDYNQLGRNLPCIYAEVE